MMSEAKIFWWPDMKKDVENKVQDCTACLASGKNLKYQLPKKHYGKLEKLSEPGQLILPENYKLNTYTAKHRY